MELTEREISFLEKYFNGEFISGKNNFHTDGHCRIPLEWYWVARRLEFSGFRIFEHPTATSNVFIGGFDRNLPLCIEEIKTMAILRK